MFFRCSTRGGPVPSRRARRPPRRLWRRRVAAQTPTATLAIEVRDASDAVMPDVTVMLTSRESGIGRRGTTNAQGTLVVSLLAPGTYLVAASRVGFKTELIRDVRLQASVKSTLSIVLEAGTVDERVDVTADRTTLVAGDSAVGEVIDRETIASLPVLERDALQFAQQVPGVAPPAPGSRLSTQGNVGLNVAGAREASNNFLLDGVDNNDLFLNRLVVNPSLDAIEEVSLLQNTYDAAYGRSAGGQVNIVVRSGTSDLKGSAYEYFRHSSLDARNSLLPDDNPEPRLRKHQFGGTLGGPIGHWPSFFFTNVEVIDGIEADTRLAHVPTAAERNGDFSASGVTLVDPFTQRPFPGNVLPASRIDPVGANLMALYPVPNHADDGRQPRVVAGRAPERHPGDDQDGSPRLAGLADPGPLHLQPRGPRPAVPDPVAQPARVRRGRARRGPPVLGVGVADVGPDVPRDAVRAERARSRQRAAERRASTSSRRSASRRRRTTRPSTRGISPPSCPASRRSATTPTCRCAGRPAPCTCPRRWALDRGRHHAKIGGELRRYQSDGYNHLFSRGQAVFTGAFTGQPAADMLLGYPTITLLAANDNRQALRTWSANMFAQDDWRVSSRLTINAGVRYEFNAPPVDADDRMAVFDLATRSVQQVGQNGVPRSGLDSDFNNFAPRVGASWDLTGRGTLVLRGGYGLFYDSGTLIENSALYFNPPYWQLQLFFPSEQGLISIADPFPTDTGCPDRADDQHHRPRVPHRLRAAGEPRPGARVHLAHADRPLRRGVRRRLRAQAQPQPASAGPRRHRRPAADPRLRRHPLPRVGGDVALPRAAAGGRAAVRARPGLQGRLHVGDVRGRHVVVPRHRRRRQHAAEQPRLRRRVGPVRLRRPAPAGRLGDVERAGGRQRAGAAAALAAERHPHRAVRPAVHAARQLRQQQHRQHRRRHVRLRPAERGHRSGAAGRAHRHLRRPGVRDRAAVHVRQRRPQQPDRARLRVARLRRCRSAWRWDRRGRWSCGWRSSTRCRGRT